MKRRVFTPGDVITADKLNTLSSHSEGYTAAEPTRPGGRVRTGCFRPSFTVELNPDLSQNVAPGFIVCEGGVPFIPEPLEELYGYDFAPGQNIYLTIFTKASEASTDPSTSLPGEIVPEAGASAKVTTEEEIPSERPGYLRTVIKLSEWGVARDQTQDHPLQQWASDIFITKKGSIHAASIPVYIRTRPEPGWPEENAANNGLECFDESDPTKWQYALALKRAHEQYSYVDGEQPYQLGGVYSCRVNVGGTQPQPGARPYISTGEIVYPLASQDTSGSQYKMHAYGLVYAAAFTDELEPYVRAGVVYIPRCNCGSGVGSSVAPSGGGSYNPGGGGYIPLPAQPSNLTEQ